jgi:hypothetical protein
MAFMFRLEDENGQPVEPLMLKTAVPNWKAGDTVPLGRGRILRVVDVRDDDADRPPRLVVEDLSGPATGESTA